jgi:hypothetical protein
LLPSSKLTKARALSFSWDDETGALAGRDAKIVGDFIANAERQRFVPIEPHPQGYRIGQAPYSATDLAAILGQWYELPPILEAARPIGENDGDDTPAIY